jgi:uncharacterized protein (TIGR02145 family)
MNRKCSVTTVIFLLSGLLFAQKMNIHTNGRIDIYNIADIDSITFNATSSSGTVTDIDGNVYQTVTLGGQVWMAENLKVTRYRNGDPIPCVNDASAWSGLSTGAYCHYNNDFNNAAIYGRLYNWYAVSDSRNIAPGGWHVPTDTEWQTLVDLLGGSSVAGGKMKTTGTIQAGTGLWRLLRYRHQRYLVVLY